MHLQQNQMYISLSVSSRSRKFKKSCLGLVLSQDKTKTRNWELISKQDKKLLSDQNFLDKKSRNFLNFHDDCLFFNT